RCIDETEALPLPDKAVGHGDHPYSLPGGAGLTTDTTDVVRGIGYAVSIKNLMYSEGFDDYSTARCVVRDGRVALKFATAEVGQGFVTIAMQIARTELGLADVDFESIDTAVGSAGSTSASRQTWMSGGAVVEACRGVVGQILDQVATDRGLDRAGLRIEGEWVTADGVPVVKVCEAVAGHLFEYTAEYHHPETTELDEYGQGDCHTAFAFTAHRAVVDVDPDLGLLRVVQIATAQDVGRALNPLSVVGQIEGGVAQGLGLAVMEEIIQTNGVIRNASFTDYLIPTIADMPPVVISLVEEPDPRAPLGAKGVGEPPCISVTPAIVAAVDDALRKAGRRVSPLTRVPIRPQDIALAGEGSTATVGS
ncbi:MAG: xanthine dehydrogenase family protein molybdopterin-binding subunit, partial [Ilumatobacteraceae bacterium]